MATKRHKKDTATFQELDYAGQTKSITAQINLLVKSINAHVIRAQEECRNADEMKNRVIMQIIRAVGRIGK